MSTATPDAEASHFREALTRLANDSDYRAKTTQNPVLLTQDYHLSDKDLQALRQVASMSGADTSQIDKVVGEWSEQQGAGLKDVNVTVSCCCCCCCGETGSVVAVA
jgi:hypothetical protein